MIIANDKGPIKISKKYKKLPHLLDPVILTYSELIEEGVITSDNPRYLELLDQRRFFKKKIDYLKWLNEKASLR
tara:strand:- start:305 stop:526 length:222 start_codon:yes stop_codon:yes gene_type:complete